jgi:hypothetical protein
MKQTIRTLLLAALLTWQPASINAQPELDFSGYIVHFATWQKNPAALQLLFRLKPSLIMNLTRIRLRPVLYFGSSSRISVEYEMDGLRLSSAVPYLDMARTQRRQVADFLWEPLKEKKWRISHFVDRLYFRQDFSFGNLIIGRQRISFGTGRIWNPTDFFNPINPADFQKIEKDGADAASLKIYLGNFTDLQLVYNPENRWKEHNWALRFRTNLQGYDVSLVAGRVDARSVLGGDFAGNLGEAGIRAEWLISRGTEEAFVKAIAGIDYQFTPKLYGLMEYQFNGEGKKERARYEFFRLFRGEILNVARNYLFLQTTYQLHPLLLFMLSKNSNLDDGSGFWMVTATYSLSDNSALSAGGLIFHGSPGSEYDLFPSAGYLKLEWYF